MCNHERLRTVGHQVFCCICGEELPLESLIGNSKPAKAENKPINPAPNEKPNKSPAKKRAAKKAV